MDGANLSQTVLVKMALNGPIICIEDDEDDQHLIEMAAKELQIPNQLRFFNDGQEALAYLETTEERPFLILSDVNMPRMNGMELRKRINSSETLRRKSIPFIFLTTAANPLIVEMAYLETVQGFYQKANSYPELLEQIRLIVAYWKSCLHPNSHF